MTKEFNFQIGDVLVEKIVPKTRPQYKFTVIKVTPKSALAETEICGYKIIKKLIRKYEEHEYQDNSNRVTLIRTIPHQIESEFNVIRKKLI